MAGCRASFANPMSETQPQSHQPRGTAATVAGHAGPGFHHWPPGHIDQITDANALIRIRVPAVKSFGMAIYAASLQDAGLFLRVNSQGYTLGWYEMPLQDMGSGTQSALRQNEM